MFIFNVLMISRLSVFGQLCTESNIRASMFYCYFLLLDALYLTFLIIFMEFISKRNLSSKLLNH